MSKRIILSLIAISTFSTAIHAQTESNFGGEGEFGYALTSGNTDTENLKTKLNLNYTKEKWKHAASLQSQKQSSNNLTTADQNTYGLKSEYTLSPRTYSFGSYRYQDDKFSGFAFERSAALGVGWHFIGNETTLFDLETGAGYKEQQPLQALPPTPPINTDRISNSILRLFSKYQHTLTPNTQFLQEILMEFNSENTLTQSSTGLKVSMTEKLAFKLSYDVQQNSNPPVSREKTDRSTGVTLVYGF